MSPADADLLLDYLAGRLSARETARVQTRLKAEPPLADAYVRLARDEAAIGEWVAALLLPEPAVPPAPARGPRRPVAAGAAAVAAALLVGGLSLLLADPRPPAIGEFTFPGARVVSVHGEANLMTAAGPVPVTVGQVIRPGDRVKTGDNGGAVVALPDDARVELRNATDVRIMPPELDSRVAVETGSVRTEVSPGDGEPMTVSTPHAIVRAAAALTCVVDAGTRVTAEGGRTRLTRTSDNQSVDVPAGETRSTGDSPMAPAAPRDTFPFAGGAVTHAAVSADGYLAVRTADARVGLRAPAFGPVKGRPLAGLWAGGPAFSADGKWVAVAAADGPIHVRDGRTGRAHATIPKPAAEARAVALSPDGGRLAVGGGRWKGTAEVKVFDVATGAELAVLPAVGSVNAVVFSPDGRAIAAAGKDSAVRVWGTADWRPRGEPTPVPGEVLGLAFAPDGRTLAVAGEDGLLRLLPLAPGGAAVDLEMAGANVVALAFSPDGKSLAAAAGDRVRVWDVAARQARTTPAAHRDRVTAVAYTPDGQSLLTAGADGTVKVWDAD